MNAKDEGSKNASMKTASPVKLTNIIHYLLLLSGIAYWGTTGKDMIVSQVTQFQRNLPVMMKNYELLLKSYYNQPVSVLDRIPDNLKFSERLEYYNATEFLAEYVCDKSHGYTVKVIRRAPLMMEIENFLMPGEAEHLASLGIPIMKRSTVAGYQESDSRTSSTAFLPKSADKIVLCVEERAVELTGLPIPNLESLQVVKYVDGQQYKPHHDYFDRNYEPDNPELKRGGQRVLTIFVYLNDVAEKDGGQTFFPELNMGIQPVKNKASLWYNMDENGNDEPRTLHAGQPVADGAEKWGLNVWFREGEFV
jgi:prolyl 4-hydroxylase